MGIAQAAAAPLLDGVRGERSRITVSLFNLVFLYYHMRFRCGLSLPLLVVLLTICGGLVHATTPCANNWAGGACVGSITYTASTKLTGSVNASGAVTIN